MPTLSVLLNAYIDINIVLAVVWVSWLGLSFGLRVLGLRHTVTAQFRLLRAGFLLALISPLLLATLAFGFAINPLNAAPAVNLSDFVVSQYLQGRFAIQPSTIQTALALRSDVTSDLLNLRGPISVAILGVMCAGLGVFAYRFASSLVQLRRVISESFVWRRFGRVEMRVSDTVSVPFSTRTLTRRIVVFPSDMLADSEALKIALGHELQHLRQNDVTWEIGLELLTPLFFWNPFFYLWKRQVEVLRELACDRQVLTRYRFDVSTYCNCLIRVCHQSMERRRMFAIHVPTVGLVQIDRRLFGHRSAAVLRRRMLSLIDGRVETHPNATFASLLLPLALLTGLAIVAIQKPSDWSEDRIMLSTIINLERLAVINRTTGATQPISTAFGAPLNP